MKKLLFAMAIASTFTACRSGEKTNKDLGSSAVAPVDSITNAPLPEGVKKVVVESRAPDGTVTVTTTLSKEAEPARESKKTSASVAHATPAPVATKKKKGWSDRAKGAAIGGVGGAATGAIISKDKVAGAVIGGAIGAGGGYVIGNEIERNKKKP